MLATNYPLWDVLLTISYLVFFIFWLMLAFHVMADIVRSHDLRGLAKAAWVLVILILPLIGTLVYLIVRGDAMHQRETRELLERRTIEEYIRTIANTKE